MPKRSKLITRCPIQKSVRFAADDRLVPRCRTEHQTIARFRKQWAGSLKINELLTPLKADRAFDSLFGRHLLFRQMLGPYRVSSAFLRIDLDLDGNVISFSNRCLSNAFLKKSSHGIFDAQTLSWRLALRAARASLASRPRQYELAADPDLVVHVQLNSVRLAWKVALRRRVGRGHCTVYVDAQSQRILRTEYLSFHHPAAGLVFSPNPMVSLNRVDLLPTTAVPRNAYDEVALLDLDDSGFLRGTHVETTTVNAARRIRRPDGDFRTERGHSSFEEVMAYFHIDAAQRYLRSLNFSRLPGYRILVEVGGRTGEGSQFFAAERIIRLGRGAIPDGEDAEIIVHEYGHALHESIVPGFGHQSGSQARSLAEGFADYFAASMFEDKKGNLFRAGIASWDEKGAGGGGSPPFLRRLDVVEPFSVNMARRIEFWSNCLWTLRSHFGRRKGDLLAIGLHYFAHPQSTFLGAAKALVQANRQVDEGRDERYIIELFRRRGLPL